MSSLRRARAHPAASDAIDVFIFRGGNKVASHQQGEINAAFNARCCPVVQETHDACLRIGATVRFFFFSGRNVSVQRSLLHLCDTESPEVQPRLKCTQVQVAAVVSTAINKRCTSENMENYFVGKQRQTERDFVPNPPDLSPRAETLGYMRLHKVRAGAMERPD